MSADPETETQYGPRLAAYAARAERSRGRLHPEPPPAYRSEFQRDRDRIVHSTAFRRLKYKTQVFVSHEGDLFRNRLTHSLEVAQIARSSARALGLNEDLTEAIALSHDLGHTPFGHAGQHALNQCMRDRGGFEHNLQSLRIVDLLEQRYAGFDGLNLTFETREGILKHCSQENARRLGPVAERFLCGGQPSLEAQLTNVADEVAYNNHDIDDGLRAGLLTMDQLRAVELFRERHDQVRALYPGLDDRRVQHETVRRMIDALVSDLIVTSRTAILDAGMNDPEAVRREPEPLIRFSPEMAHQNRELKRFLRQNLYHHHRVYRMTVKARRIVHDLFSAFMEDRQLLPEHFQAHAKRLSASDEHGFARGIADYIAGMTDRHAIREHHRIFDLRTLI
ncbi:Deoxyguanosinetriphosphate triphosphohydrolase [Thioalkalivibrio nitratireducens DSM 14787]|uniref:Deoxyguanosinetriphosphate triphosphohydrolase-like protein n=1 Tax=Thioalkalivibrio nitratireducens (strain DSM 14787 / UNIQEM 213 / ALEN2) TaxID=1255043 RepID=L0E1N2_THIND|nr:deoxyguanosinetriphosphate triphosphohydrolase [Thioalkalivibrio nitratireducens]AGA35115.1 Deoxyguanosinetriphosphate triphosphohydrolase [Thioalkalivibrio nitratireducens DSM 14787]